MHIKGIWETQQVFVDDEELNPEHSLDVYPHSPDGFNWGYGGSGPAQLSLAILLIATDEPTAIRLHQSFKWEYIANLPQSDFEIDIDVASWVKRALQREIAEGKSVDD